MGSNLLDRGGADIQGEYRYELWRGDPDAVPCVFVMLNPSTADATYDDPTIRRCTSFAYGFGYDRLVVVNLFALRATDPREIRKHHAPVGPHNDTFITTHARRAGLLIAAWGASAPDWRVREVLPVLRRAPHGLHALAFTKTGKPRHPLYLRGDAGPQRWEADDADAE